MSLNVLTAGSGPPMLLLHGFTGSAQTWSALIEAWSVGRRVIAPDLLGHAGSDAPVCAAAYALERQAARLAELLDLLEAAPATVVGYSMGARLALVLTLEHPRAVGQLVLESPSAGFADAGARAERQAADEQLSDDIEAGGVEAFVDRWEALPLFASQAALPAEVRSQQRAQRRHHSAIGLAASLRGAGQGMMTPLHDRLAEIDVPTLVLSGALDTTGIERARTVAEGVAGARLEVIGEAGHAPHLETPDTFLRITNDFLTAS